MPTTQMAAELYAHGLIKGASSASWVRPSDWPAMPTSATDQIDILAAVFNSGANYCAMTITASSGTVTVDWGDGGAPQTYTSGAAINKQYSYSASGLGPLTSMGYKTALIKITPTTGGAHITAITLSTRHSSISVNASNPWLDLQVNTPSCTSLTVGNGNSTPAYLQRANIISLSSSISSLSYAFVSCAALQKVSLPSGTFSSLTNLSYMFQACGALSSITFPSGILNAATNINSLFQYCYALSSVTFPSGALAAVQSMANAFQSCASLASVSFPSGSLSSVTASNALFQGCSSLISAAFPAGALAVVSNIVNMFYQCGALQNIAFAASSLGSVTGGNTANTFLACTSLSSVLNCALPVSFTCNTNLSAADLNTLYTSLPSVSSQTLTVSSNPGYAGSTTSIATGKGWLVN